MAAVTSVVGFLLAVVLLLAGCGEGNTVRITDDWVEAPVKGRGYTPAYVTIDSDRPDVLLDANVDGSVAEHTLLFQTHDGGMSPRYTEFHLYPGEDGRMFTRHDREFKPLSQKERAEGYLVPQPVNGGPRADQVDQIEIRATDPDATHGHIPMHSAGYFMMLTGLKERVRPGESIDLELRFKHAGTVKVRTRVREKHPRARGIDREVAARRIAERLDASPFDANVSVVSSGLIDGSLSNRRNVEARFVIVLNGNPRNAARIYRQTSKAEFARRVVSGTVDGISYAYDIGHPSDENARSQLIHRVVGLACRITNGRPCDRLR